MQNTLRSNQLIHKTFKIDIQKKGPNNSDFLQNWFPPEITSHSLICRYFKILRRALQNHAECIEI